MQTGQHRLLRRFVWAVLVVCIVVDAMLPHLVIWPEREILFYEGKDLNPPPGIGMWLSVAAFIIFQGLLIFALIRLRRPNPSASLFGHVTTRESH